MSVKVIQNRWDGGIAEDIRTESTTESEKSLNFDIFTNPKKLTPYRDSVAETVTAATITDFILNGVVYTGSVYWTVGRTSSGSAVPRFYYKTNINDAWTVGNAGEAGSTIINGTLVLYQGVAYVLATKSTGKLILIDSTGTTKATSTLNVSQNYTPTPFVHPEDKVLYMVCGYTILTWNGSTQGESSTLLPTDGLVTSLTNYGTYLAIACNLNGGGSGGAVVYLWGRDTTLNTFQGQIPFGDNLLMIIENIQNSLVGVIYSAGSLSIVNPDTYTPETLIDIAVYSGGAVEVVKSILPEVAVNGTSLTNFKTKYKDTLYFAMLSGNAVYAVRKNKGGLWTIAKDRYFYNGTAVTSSVIPTVIGGRLWTSFASGGQSGYFYRTKIVSEVTYASKSIFKTTINPKMPIADRNSLKQLEAVRVSYTGQTNGTVKLRYSVDGSLLTGTADPTASTTLTGTGTLFLTELAVGDLVTVNNESRVVTAIASNTSLTVDSAFSDSVAGKIYKMVSIISETTTAIEDVKEATMQNDGNAFLSGREFQFQIESTGGVEIKEVEYKYSVLNN